MSSRPFFRRPIVRTGQGSYRADWTDADCERSGSIVICGFWIGYGLFLYWLGQLIWRAVA